MICWGASSVVVKTQRRGSRHSMSRRANTEKLQSESQTTKATSFLHMKTLFLFWCASTALLTGALAHADVVTEWNNAALNAIRAGNTVPPIASRSLAILHVSICDQLNMTALVDRAFRHG
jgi:ABC-type proline/glycine betaine transport system permease subunit